MTHPMTRTPRAGARIEWDRTTPGSSLTATLLRGSGRIVSMTTDDPDPMVAALMLVEMADGERLHLHYDPIYVRVVTEAD